MLGYFYFSDLKTNMSLQIVLEVGSVLIQSHCKNKLIFLDVENSKWWLVHCRTLNYDNKTRFT